MTISNPPSTLLNLAFFPFRAKDGGQPAPNSPTFSGSIQFSMEQAKGLPLAVYIH